LLKRKNEVDESKDKDIQALAEDGDSASSAEIESWGRLVWRRFRKHKLAMTGLIVIIVITFPLFWLLS